MHTIRRLYFYSVAFITLEVVLWGLISLLRSMFSAGLSGSGDTLAGALSMILVGVPIFALHWLWAQRASAADEEEHTASLRAIFLYGALLATLIPVTQNALALLDRSLISAAGLDTFRAVFGGSQTWVDNLIAILMNSIAAAYFVNVVRRDWATLSDKENFADIRRLYRFIWLLYSLLMVVYGIQQIIRFLLYIPADTLGQNSRDLFINGLSLLLVGVPIWYFSWKTCQDALSQPGEHGSTLRLGLLYLLALSGVAVVLSASGSVVDMLLRWMLGEQMTVAEFVGRISGTLATALPLGAVWAYYGHWLHHDIRATADEGRRDELRRFYFYILSLAGLVTAFVGTALLVSFILDVVVGRARGADRWASALARDLASDAGAGAFAGQRRRFRAPVRGAQNLSLPCAVRLGHRRDGLGGVRVLSPVTGRARHPVPGCNCPAQLAPIAGVVHRGARLSPVLPARRRVRVGAGADRAARKVRRAGLRGGR
jgi:hypothetical protein